MSTLSLAAAAAGGKGRRGGKTPGGAALGREAGRDARLVAAAVLEVLAGARTPAEAAAALGLSLQRYYQVEAQALRGLVAACEPRPRGRQPSPARELAALHQENRRLRRDVGRQEALVRAARRAVGLAAPPAAPAKAAGKKPRRRRRARALDVAAHLRAAGPEAPQSSPAGDPAGAGEE